MTSSEEPMSDKPRAANAMLLLVHFQNKFLQTYGVAPQINVGRDLKILKQVKILFEEANQPDQLLNFLDFCFDSHKSSPISTPYILKAANLRFGYVNGKQKSKTKGKVATPEVQSWIAEERKKWNNKLI